MMEKSKLILVRDSISGKGLELAKDLLKKGTRVMINGSSQEAIIKKMIDLAHEFPVDLIYGVPGNIMSVQEFENFYGNPKIDEVVTA